MKAFENKLRNIVRDSIGMVEPEHVDAVVDTILTDSLGGASLALEKVVLDIDDSMNYYEIRNYIIEFKGDIDLMIMKLTKSNT